MMKKTYENRWDEYHRKTDYGEIDRTLPEVVDMFKLHGVDKILDLGCGTGRHVLYLADLGFEVYGLDVSEEAIETAKILLKERNLHAELDARSMHERLDYEDRFFDAVICIRVLNHGKIEDIRETIGEIERILRPGGLVYVTVRKKVTKDMRLPFREISPRTYIPLEGKEKGIIHYMFNKELLRKEFRNFRLHRLSIEHGPVEWEAYYCLLGELKKQLKCFSNLKLL
jgi:ubiquinone/menaquinone biosynthesis C-methylase UbiE